MNNAVLTNVWRFLLLVLIQVLILKRIAPDYGLFIYMSVIIYPIFIMLLPIRTPHVLAIALGFLLGITIDFFYDSIGVHASATVFIAFVRPYILSALEPRGGYTVNQSPTKKSLGINWFMIYSGILLFLHLFFYFSVEVFTFVYIGEIILRSVFSFFISMFFVIAYQYILDPKN